MRTLRKGFTAVELLIGIMLAGITLLAAFLLMFYFYRAYNEIQNKIEAEKAVTLATFNLQRALSLAVNIEASPIPFEGLNLAATDRGKIRSNFVADTMGASPGVIETVALFLREKGGYQATARSEYTPVGIFYVRPTPTTSGVLFIDTNALGTLSPSYDDMFFQNITEFSLTNHVNSPNGVLTSVEFSITVRKFISSDTKTWNFCPALDITNAVAGCTTDKSTFMDITRTMQVTFSNQILNDGLRDVTGAGPYERVIGNLYLFPQK